VSRFWSRLVALVSLAAYFIANTNASLAIQSYLPNQATKTAEVSAATQKGCSESNEHCKDCCQSGETESTESDHAPSPLPTCPNGGNSDESSCPCCPKDSNEKSCPCPGGCVLCSVAKAPCLTPSAPILDVTVCLGLCCVTGSLDYVAPLQIGLIRPPRA